MKKNIIWFCLVYCNFGFSQELALPSNELMAAAEISIEQHIITPNQPNEKFSSALLEARLAQLNESTPFEVVYNATIERFIRLYLKTKTDFFSELIGRSERYFPLFEEQLDKHNLPLELKYLSVVESALLPTSKSRVGAAGLWQFMYHTGKENGLSINSFVDERADPFKSTQAACRYLSYLYERFGNWELALAAYNAGPGNVSKAIRMAGGQRNYWNIRQFLPAETRGYVPAFYTTLYLFSFADAHDIYPVSLPLKYIEIDTVRVETKTSFRAIADKTGLSLADLVELNPQYKLKTIPKDYIVSLPKEHVDTYLGIPKAELFNTNVEPARYITPNPYNSYEVQPSDNLQKIAAKFSISVAQLKAWNGLQTDYLIAHQRLVITDQKVSEPLTPVARLRVKPTTVKSEILHYVVQEGDSLFKISKKYDGVSINDLRTWNKLWDSSYVKPGTQLQILTKHK